MSETLIRINFCIRYFTVLLLMNLFASVQAFDGEIKPDVYKKAENFIGWNKSKLVLNGDIHHHWINGQDIFWYQHQMWGDKYRFVVVDATTGKSSPAFDHFALASTLAKMSEQTVDAEQLPFNKFTFDSGRQHITFAAFDKEWLCSVSGASCRATEIKDDGSVVSPDGKWRVFVKDHNLYVASTRGGAPRALTTDGIEHYAYGEHSEGMMYDVTLRRQGKQLPAVVLWSPDSRRILTHRLDERQVKPLHLLQSAPEDGSFRPKLYSYRYAMTGDKEQPFFSFMVFDVESGKRVNIGLEDQESFFTVFPMSVTGDSWWTQDSKKLYMIGRDSYKRAASLFLVDATSGNKKRLIREESDTLVRLEHRLLERPIVRALDSGDIIWFSERDGFGHLYLYDGNTGEIKIQLTSGNWLVRDILRVDEKNGWIYFLGLGRETGRDPYFRHVYRVDLNGDNLTLLTQEDADHLVRVENTPAARNQTAIFGGESTGKAEAGFSPSGKYFIDSYSTPQKPTETVIRTSTGKKIAVVVKQDTTELDKLGYIPVESFQAVAADGVTPLYGNIFRPSSFDPKKRYAIIDSIYPGPQVNRTAKRFDEAIFGWNSYDAQAIAELGFIVFTVDGRGNPDRSRAFFNDVYGQMGKAGNLEDHIAVIRQLAERYASIDLNKVGIYGHSGGGYASAHAMFQYPDFFKVAVSSAGNHDQRGYTYAWGAIYNGPEKGDNFDNASNPPFVKGLKGKLLLVHGEMDDNVHPALTMQVVDALVKENKDFDMMILPNQFHGYTTAAAFFKRKRWDYFVEHLMGKTPPREYRITMPEK